jgi:hypothetical protein
VEPAAQGLPLADGSGPAGQQQERGLEAVLGVFHPAEHPPADAEDHRPVPLEERCERRLVSPAEVGREQLAVRFLTVFPGRGERPQVLHDLPGLRLCHWVHLGQQSCLVL